jgi:MFS family permease
MQRPKHILPLIVLAQFCGTSLWFVGNAILPELKQALDLSTYAVSNITSAVMIGFIAGTLLFSFLSLPDRYSPVLIFLICSIAGALSNASIAWIATNDISLYLLRFITGFFMAGIYPVGMKIAADWYEKGLGKALGLLLGALILGTAFPHLLKNREFALPWKSVLYFTSGIATAGGLSMYLFVGDGPFHRKAGAFRWNAIGEIFSSGPWRRAAFGYFGHMWELYCFWGFVPVILALYAEKNKVSLDISLLSFIIIGSGMISSIAGGYISQKTGSAKVAFVALLISGICCFVSPLSFQFPLYIFILFMLLWGLTVSPDSPQFSTLVTQFAPQHLRGTALTIYNSIGFTITTVSLIVIDRIFYSHSFLARENAFIILGLGAVMGLPAMIKLIRARQ